MYLLHTKATLVSMINSFNLAQEFQTNKIKYNVFLFLLLGLYEISSVSVMDY